MKFSIRQANYDDIEAVVELEKLCFSDAWQKKAFLCELEIAQFVVAEYGDDKKTLAGYCIYNAVCDFGELFNIAVAPQFRRMGLGKMLLNHFLSAAQQNGATQFFLEVRTTNDVAIELYTDFGFEIISLRKQYYDDGGDAFVMKKVLNN